MEFINITGPAATQITDQHPILSYCMIALCLLHFTLLLFALLVVNSFFSFSMIFSLRATMLINLNLNLWLYAICKIADKLRQRAAGRPAAAAICSSENLQPNIDR